MEEGKVWVTKMGEERERRGSESVGSESGSSDEKVEEDTSEHPNLRMVWTWSEVDGKR